MGYVIGIDAGGTKTVGLLANRSGEICASARAGGANILVEGEVKQQFFCKCLIGDLWLRCWCLVCCEFQGFVGTPGSVSGVHIEVLSA